ncbi:hypothetical protein P9112_004618 [Eukaryota sp. TZLM1-RC]
MTVTHTDYKEAGNKFFQQKDFANAIEEYSKVINASDVEPELLTICYANSAAANLQLENFQGAKDDALECLKLRPKASLLHKAYFRLAQAYFNLQNFDGAVLAFERLVKFLPDNPAIKAELRKARIAAATARREKMLAACSIDEEVKTNELPEIPNNYTGAILPAANERTLTNILEQIKTFRTKVPHPRVVKEILQEGIELLSKESTVVDLPLTEGSKAVVIGDVHGQIFDLLTILNDFSPSDKTPFVFLGDYVDRGSYSVEVLMSCLLLKIACPEHVVLLRGNHETMNLTSIYGCKEEVSKKLCSSLYGDFLRVFRALPLACVINNSAFCVHGGIPVKPNVTLTDINSINRFRDPGVDSSDDLMSSLLWSDPCASNGVNPSKRGSGYSFGPDITEAFLTANNLDVVLRGHEQVNEGYAITHQGKLSTIFSAPNYVNLNNRAALGFYDFNGDLTFHQFSESPQPPNALPSLYYCNNFSMFM